jgi:hypothetical protein
MHPFTAPLQYVHIGARVENSKWRVYMEKSNLIIIRNAEPDELPLAKATIYKNLSLKKMPNIIYKVPGVGVVFDINEYEATCEQAKAKQVEKAERIHRPIEA